MSSTDEALTACRSIWETTLGISAYSDEQSLLELGGTSLKMVMLLWRVSDELGIDIELLDFISDPSFKCLGELVSDRLEGAHQATVIEPISSDTPPLSSAQKSLWYIDQMEGASAKYNVTIAFRIEGKIDLVRLHFALDKLLDRHKALRLNFADIDGVPTLIDLQHTQVPINYISFTDADGESGSSPLTALADEANRVFDLSRDVLVNASVIEDTENRQLLLFNMHHIVSDGWSLAVFATEVSKLYSLASKNGEANLEALPIQYPDYAHWHNNYLSSDSFQEALFHWKKQLHGLPLSHDIPLDYPRPSKPSISGRSFRRGISQATFNQLKQLARSCNASLFVVIQALYAIVIRRWSNQGDIPIGSPYAGRHHKSMKDMIGYFANTLVIRNDLSGDPTLRDLIKRIQGIASAAISNANVPFEKIVDAINPARVANQNPLFQLFFALQDNEAIQLQLDDLPIEEIEAPNRTAKFDIALHIFERDNGSYAHWEYADSIFKEETIQAMAEAFSYVMVSADVHLDTPIDAIPILAPADQQALLLDESASATASETTNIAKFFTAAAQQRPQQTCLQMGKDRWSFQQIEMFSNRVARYLKNHGVNLGECVLICAQRSAELIIGVLGILKSGAHYCPIDRSLPKARRANIIRQSTARIALGHGIDEATLGGITVAGISDIIYDEAYAEDFMIPDHPATIPAYLLFTSGSTGQPKGVVQSHRTIINLIEHQGLDRSLTTLQFTPITFDVSIQELATCWYTASPLVLINESQKNALDGLPLLMHDQGIERVFMPPALLNILAEDLCDGVSRLKEIIVAGEALKLETDLRRFLQQSADCDLWNHYGPTETHVAALHRVDAQRDAMYPPIGGLVKGHRGYILNPSGQVAPKGAIGELYISGPGLAIGYKNLHEVEEKSFIDNPYAIHGHERLYRTGDLVRVIDGKLNYIGRADRQIKIRGFRIELKEIESILSAIENVRDCVVEAKTIQGQDHLVAYVVAHVRGASRVWTIKQSLARHLPDYMVPEFFVFLERLPFNRNGKLDRASLPVPDIGVAQKHQTGPTTTVEMSIARIWRSVLGLDSDIIDINMNFFALGGHSLSLVRLHNKLKREYQSTPELVELFRSSTIWEQARLVEAKATNTDCYRAIASLAREEDRFPVSYQQRRLWFIDQLSGKQATYNIPIAFKLTGSIDLLSLERAFKHIMAQHWILRSVYAVKDGEVFGKVIPVEGFSLRVDVHQSGRENRSFIDRWIMEKSLHCFDLTRDFMLKVDVLKVNDQSHYLVINTHHIASDGWTLNLLSQMLVREYGRYSAPSTLEKVPAIQYADYVHWQLGSSHYADQTSLQFWLDTLSDAPPLHQLPLDRPRDKVSSHANTLVRDISQKQLTALRTIAEAQGATLFMAVESIFALLIARWSCQDEIVIGTAVAGRSHPDIENTLGFFANVVSLRNHIPFELSFIDYLKITKDMIVSALAHQDYPFELLVDKLKPDRNSNFNPLFQIAYSMADIRDVRLNIAGVDTEYITIPSQVAKVDLAFHIEIGDTSYHGLWTYSTALFDRETIVRMAEGFAVLLEAIVGAPNASLLSYPIVSTSEKNRILEKLSRGRSVARTPTTITASLKSICACYGDNIAVSSEHERLSYDQLERAASVIAGNLRLLGVSIGDRVGIRMERGPSFVVAMYAVLIRGGTIVPIARHLPSSRVEYIIQDCDAKLLISDSIDETSCGIEVLYYDAGAGQIPKAKLSEPDIYHATLKNPCVYIIYTSGTTGAPKGVAVSHESLINLCQWHEEKFKTQTGSVVSQVSDIMFDASQWEIWSTLLCGANLHFISDAQRLSPVELRDAFTEHGVTHCFFPTGLLHALENAVVWDAPHLQTVYTGGDRLEHYCLPRDKNLPLYNMYGPSETTVIACCARVYPDDNPPSVGRPIDNVSVYVMNAENQLQPVGSVGELCIDGAGVAIGYVNSSQLTEERFISSPFTKKTRLYRTGDMVRFKSDGRLEFLGRADGQVKIRGYRIELSEIENQLDYLAEIDMARVLVDGEGVNRQMIAFVQVNTESRGNPRLEDIIYTQLAKKLPKYMLPDVLMLLDTMPLTSVGKIDNRALFALEWKHGRTQNKIPLKTRTERLLGEIWGRFIDCENIGSNESFFDVGGNSLIAMKLLAQIGADLDVDISIREFFERQTISGLAKLIDQKQQYKKNSNLLERKEIDTEEIKW